MLQEFPSIGRDDSGPLVVTSQNTSGLNGGEHVTMTSFRWTIEMHRGEILPSVRAPMRCKRQALLVKKVTSSSKSQPAQSFSLKNGHVAQMECDAEKPQTEIYSKIDAQ